MRNYRVFLNWNLLASLMQDNNDNDSNYCSKHHFIFSFYTWPSSSRSSSCPCRLLSRLSSDYRQSVLIGWTYERPKEDEGRNCYYCHLRLKIHWWPIRPMPLKLRLIGFSREGYGSNSDGLGLWFWFRCCRLCTITTITVLGQSLISWILGVTSFIKLRNLPSWEIHPRFPFILSLSAQS